MKIFISSVIADYADRRDAAARGCETLDYQVIRAEDFGASPNTAQRVCLDGVRKADAVILILGRRYGWTQPSGLSATHEEYHEARERCPVLVFVENVPDRETEQDAFVREVQAWSSGMYTAEFATPAQLEQKVVRALHELALAKSAGPVEEKEMLARAQALVPRGRASSSEPRLFVIATGGPAQPVLRPSEIEDPVLKRSIQKAAMFGDAAVFDESGRVDGRLDDDALLLDQEGSSIHLDAQGSLRVMIAAREASPRDYAVMLPALVEEEVTARLERCLRFIAWALDHVDPRHRLSDVVIVAGLTAGGHFGWQTRAERHASPNSVTMGRGDDVVEVRLSPARRNRPALQQEAAAIARDLMVLLRRRIRP